MYYLKPIKKESPQFKISKTDIGITIDCKKYKHNETLSSMMPINLDIDKDSKLCGIEIIHENKFIAKSVEIPENIKVEENWWKAREDEKYFEVTMNYDKEKDIYQFILTDEEIQDYYQYDNKKSGLILGLTKQGLLGEIYIY